MGCRIIVGHTDNGLGRECALFYDSCTDTVFGDIMEDLEEAETFQQWMIPTDLRLLSDIEFGSMLGLFREMREREAE